MDAINPYNNQIIYSLNPHTPEQVIEGIEKAATAFEMWKETSFEERSSLMKKAASVLEDHKMKYAKTMTLEMGKPISQSIAEIEKCVWVSMYYAENAKIFLQREHIETDAAESYVSFEPLGVVLAVMPWNYPFWQVFRFAVPALMAGNVGILKHASNVMQSALNIQDVFVQAGFPDGAFQSLIVSSDAVEGIIKHPQIKAVTLTGSKTAGSSVASLAAKEIKKSVLELGGNNGFIVLKDANLEKAVKTAVNARFQNTGQSCIAAKRLLLQEDIADAFLEKFIHAVQELKSGDPMDPSVYIGVLAKESMAIELEEQLSKSLKMGAKILIGGQRKGAYFSPTVVTDITEDMPVFKEETFGPVITVNRFKTIEQAIELSNNSVFGLGVSLFTESKETAIKIAPRLQEGAVFVNELVKSDPRLPFGGIKQSGFGRELSSFGIREFVNIKTVYIS